MEDRYTYLFPYERIPQGVKILIYGAGDVGQEYLKQMMLTKYATVLGFVDRAWDKYPQMVVPIYSPEQVRSISFDYIVLAFKMGNFALDVQQMLVRQGIPDEKIVFQGARKKPMPVLAGNSVDTTGDGGLSYAFDEAPVSIALKYGPGLGDAIIKKQLFMEIAKFAPMAKIDIYAPKASLWIPAIYRDMPNFHRAIDDGGVLYVDNQEKYGLSMSIFYLVQMDQVKYDLLDQYCPVLSDMARKIEAANAAYNLSIYPATQNAIHFARSIFRGWNCYTLYNYTGAFQLSSMKVSIPLDASQRERWQQMHLGDYVTINYGNGASSKGQKQIVSKQWPKEYFERLAELLKQVYPHIKLVQIGDKSADNLDHMDRYILGEDLELVKYILKGSLLHIDIEGGLMHLATQLGTKCICILGPTQKELFSYPENINLISDRCNGCYCLYDNTYQCARGLEHPECMYDITPEIVFRKVAKFMNDQYIKVLNYNYAQLRDVSDKILMCYALDRTCINKKIPDVYRVVKESLVDSIFITLARIIDKNKRAAGINFLVDKLKGITDIEGNVLEEITEKINEFYPRESDKNEVYEKIKKFRDKLLAHSDRKFLKNPYNLGKIQWLELEQLVIDLDDLFCNIYKALGIKIDDDKKVRIEKESSLLNYLKNHKLYNSYTKIEFSTMQE